MFKKKTVAEVVSVFTKTIEDLHRISKDNDDKADLASEAIKCLEEVKREHRAESAAADKFAYNIDKMLNG